MSDKWKTFGLACASAVFALGLCLIVGSLLAAIGMSVAKVMGAE